MLHQAAGERGKLPTQARAKSAFYSYSQARHLDTRTATRDVKHFKTLVCEHSITWIASYYHINKLPLWLTYAESTLLYILYILRIYIRMVMQHSAFLMVVLSEHIQYIVLRQAPWVWNLWVAQRCHIYFAASSVHMHNNTEMSRKKRETSPCPWTSHDLGKGVHD